MGTVYKLCRVLESIRIAASSLLDIVRSKSHKLVLSSRRYQHNTLKLTKIETVQDEVLQDQWYKQPGHGSMPGAWGLASGWL